MDRMHQPWVNLRVLAATLRSTPWRHDARDPSGKRTQKEGLPSPIVAHLAAMGCFENRVPQRGGKTGSSGIGI
jgi:hypothetical protein